MRIKTVVRFQASKVIDFLISLAWQSFLAHQLFKSDFASYTLLISFSGVWAIVVSFGGDETYLASTKNAKKIYLFELKRRILVTTLIALLSGLAFLYGSPEWGLGLLFLCLTTLHSLVLAYFAKWEISTPILVSQLTSTVGLVLMISFSGTMTSENSILMSAVSLAIRLSTLLIFTRHQSKEFFSGPSKMRLDFSGRTPLLLSALSGSLLGRQMDILIGGTVGASLVDVADYSAAYSLVYLASTFLILGLGSVALPRLAKASNLNSVAMSKAWKHQIVTTTALSIPPLCFTGFFGLQASSILFGSKYGVQTNTFIIELAAILIIQRLFGGGTNLNLLITTGSSSALLRTVIYPVAVAAACDVALIPRLGMQGAVIGTLFSTLTSSYMMYRSARSLITLGWPAKKQLKVLALSLGTASFAFVICNVLPDFSLAMTLLVAASLGTVALLLSWRVAKQNDE